LARGSAALLGVLGSLGFVESHGGRFGLTEAGKLYLTSAHPFYWGPMLMTDSGFNEYMHNKVKHSVQTDTPKVDSVVKEWEGEKDFSDKKARKFTLQMQSHSLTSALAAAQNYEWSSIKSLLDIAGGSGCFSIAIARNNTHLKATVLDLPAVCVVASEFIEKAQVADRVNTTSVDFFQQPLPSGYDAHFYSNVFHDWTVEQCKHLALSSFKALSSGGKILLHEMLLDDGSSSPSTTAAFSMHMLVHCKGKQYTFGELHDILSGAGFTDIKPTKTSTYYSIISGTKP